MMSYNDNNDKNYGNDIIDINLKDYVKEEDTGFLYKKKVDRFDNKFNLIGSGSYYQNLRLSYSVGFYMSFIDKIKLNIKDNSNRNIKDINQNLLYFMLQNETDMKLIILKLYRQIDLIYFIKCLKYNLEKEVSKHKIVYTEKENKDLLIQIDYLSWILKKGIKKNNLNMGDELYFLLKDKNQLEIYYGNCDNEKEIAIEEIISKNVCPINKEEKIGLIIHPLLNYILFNLYTNENIISNLKYQVNKFILDMIHDN